METKYIPPCQKHANQVDKNMHKPVINDFPPLCASKPKEEKTNIWSNLRETKQHMFEVTEDLSINKKPPKIFYEQKRRNKKKIPRRNRRNEHENYDGGEFGYCEEEQEDDNCLSDWSDFE